MTVSFSEKQIEMKKHCHEYSCNSNGSEGNPEVTVISKFFREWMPDSIDKSCHQEKCKWNFWKNLCFQINRQNGWYASMSTIPQASHSANSFLKYKTHKLHNAIRNTDSRISRVWWQFRSWQQPVTTMEIQQDKHPQQISLQLDQTPVHCLIALYAPRIFLVWIRCIE